MQAYTDTTGSTFRGKGPDEVVQQMHKCSQTQCGNDSEFMAETAYRVSAQMGINIRDSSPEDFIYDLVNAGLLKEAEYSETD